jgi:hypothetical protein
MEFMIAKNNDSTWTLTPLSGVFKNRKIAQADRVALKRVRFEGKTMIGRIKALWGLNLLCDEVFDDNATLRALALQGVFDELTGDQLMIDYDGFSTRAQRCCKAAARVFAVGDEIFAKGVV